MITGAHNIFLDRDGHGEERGPSTYVKRFGSGRPRDLNGFTLESRPSSPSHAQSSEAMLRSRPGSRQCLPATQFNESMGISVSKHSFCRKDKRLLPLLHPKDEEMFFHSPLNMTPNIEHCPNATADIEDAVESNLHEAVEDDAVTSQQGVWTQPLEERFSLDDLRRLMYFFSADSDVFRNNTLESAEGTTGLLRGDSIKKEAAKDVLSALNGSSEREGPVGRAKQSPQLEGRLPSCEEQSHEHPPKRSFKVLTRTRFPQRTEKELQRALLSSDPVNCGLEHDAYTRVLSKTEFAQAVKIVIPSATDAEIMDLLGKVDYEAKGCTTWDDFSTFLVSRSRHRSQLAHGPVSELLATPEPDYCPPCSRHLTGTCMESDKRRNLLLTGGSEGTVRAWDLETLTSRGIVFAGDSWVVGVHWANQLQSILIVTVDRKVILLDSKTLEVSRLYRGRAIVDTMDGYLYAYDSVQAVKVGGKVNAKGRKLGSRGAVGFGGSTFNNSSGGSSERFPVGRGGEAKKQKASALATCLVSPSTGPFVQCLVEECMLAGLVDSVSCSLFHHSRLREDVLLLATVVGEVRFYVIPKASHRVLSPYVVVRLHEKSINKMSFLFDNNSLLTASDDGSVKMTSLETGALLRVFFSSGAGQHSAVHDFAVNTQWRLLVTVGPERYGVVWDFSHDAPLAILDAHNSPCRCCA
ncbi:hypothetical protein TRSC58_01742 [Trypanosoma rangeli SC58]|uniref:Uncharacterized protein n=1 Tax=Trypanosoma rangeli SC58 TaxID=429131 RepID=A0A061J853_TRYRA|nr:hypothetical protein TRSC58_01742 [Trypanosoma rangeli SC58]